MSNESSKSKSPRTTTGGDYVVGHGRPPVEHQFKKGTSGNPKGRKKKPERSWTYGQWCTDILQALSKPASIIGKDGKKEIITLQEALFRRVLADAVQGKASAQKLAVNLLLDALAGRKNLFQRFYDALEQSEAKFFSGPKSKELCDFQNYVRKLSREIV